MPSANNLISNLDAVKQNNLIRLFRIIVEFGLISRTQLVEESGLAAGSVTKLSRLLIEQGLVHEVAQMESERGRKAVLLAPKVDDIQILAARADRKHLYVGLCDLSGNLLQRDSEPLNATSETDFTEQIVRSLQTFLTQHAALVRNIVGIGVTMPGLVDADQGVVNFMPHVPVNALPLKSIIEENLNLPCYINGFASAMALAEKQIGASFHARNSIFIEVHNGVGAGIILNDDLYSGTGVGEIGHIQVDPLGKHCICGNYGCLETVVSDGAMSQQFQQLWQRAHPGESIDYSVQSIMARAENNEPEALQVVKEASVQIGTAMAMISNLFRPEMVILAGEITKAWSIIEPILEQQLQTKSLQINGIQKVTLSRSELYDSPWYSGYALVRRGLLSGDLSENLFTLRD